MILFIKTKTFGFWVAWVVSFLTLVLKSNFTSQFLRSSNINKSVQQREDLSPVPLRAHMHANPAFRQTTGFATSVFAEHLGWWWFQTYTYDIYIYIYISFICTPIWRNDPIWLVFFQMGWNHQLVWDDGWTLFFRGGGWGYVPVIIAMSYMSTLKPYDYKINCTNPSDTPVESIRNQTVAPQRAEPEKTFGHEGGGRLKKRMRWWMAGDGPFEAFSKLMGSMDFMGRALNGAGAQTHAAGSKRYPELDGSLPQKLQEMQDSMDVQVSMSMQQFVALTFWKTNQVLIGLWCRLIFQ